MAMQNDIYKEWLMGKYLIHGERPWHAITSDTNYILVGGGRSADVAWDDIFGRGWYITKTGITYLNAK